MGIKDALYSPVTFSHDPPVRPTSTALYPLKGILYFLVHPSLWKIIICPLIITILVFITAVVLIFSLALYPQYLLFEELTNITWLSWILAVAFCLVEIFLILVLTFIIFFDGTRRRIYSKVFEIEGVSVRVVGTNGKATTLDEETVFSSLNQYCACWIIVDFIECIKGCIFCCCFDRRHCTFKIITGIIFFASLPLNLIPIIGTILFCVINGTMMAWRMHLNYFQKKELPPSVCSYILKHRFYEYMSFGTVCMLLDLIPVIDIILIYTNIVASGKLKKICFSLFIIFNFVNCIFIALWVVEIERSGMYDSIAFPSDELVDPLLEDSNQLY